MFRSLAVFVLATILAAAPGFAAGPLVVDLDAQADVLADRAFKTGDVNRDKSLNEAEQKKAVQEFLRRVIADAKKLGADGIAMARVAKMINDAKLDTDADGAVSHEEFREFARDAWTDRLELLMGPAPVPVVPVAPMAAPVIVVVERPDKDDDSDRLRELRRRDRQRQLQLEWERRQRELWEQRNNFNNPPVVINQPGPNRVYSRQDADDDRSSSNNRNDQDRTERKERSSESKTDRSSDSRSSSDSGRSNSRSDKEEKSSSSGRGSRSR